nr:MAG TPA: hypothetical protein [Caudoviricetes sp.]
MHFMDKYKKSDGTYEIDGLIYDTIEDALMMGVFGFCGCGMPWYTLAYIRDELESIKRYTEWVNENHHITKDIPSPMENNDKEENLGRSYFIWYWFDKMGYTDHGGSVPGWLTDEGESLLECLKELDLD